MDPRVFAAVCLISAATVALVTFDGRRTQTALRGGVSRMGLIIGLSAGGAIVTVFDLILAFGLMTLWNAVIGPGLGAGAVALITPFLLVAIVHIWSTWTLTRRRWRAQEVPIERDLYR